MERTDDDCFGDLLQYCEAMMVEPCYEAERRALLAMAPERWWPLVDVLPAASPLKDKVAGAEPTHGALYFWQGRTPDGTAMLVNFFATGIQAVIATALIEAESHPNLLMH